MSYIMQRYKCSYEGYGDEFNVSLGSFGGGFPLKCSNGHSTKGAELILDGAWKWDDGSIWPRGLS